MKIRIDYYTGTGGSEMVAKQLAVNLTAKGCAVALNRIIRDKFVVSDDFDYYVLLFAVHSFNAPRPVFEWVQREQRKSPFWIDILISAAGQCEKLVTKKFGLGIEVTDSCTGCGLCAKRCCSSNIIIENGRAVIGSRCDMCLGCIYGCPQKALVATYGGFQVDKKGYNLKAMQKK